MYLYNTMSKIQILKKEGNKHFKNEEYSKAIKCYKEGLEIEPKNSTLNSNLSQAYLAVDDFCHAEVHAVVTLAHRTDSVKPFYRASKAALRMMKPERAFMYLKAGVKFCPKAEELKSVIEEISKGNIDLPIDNTLEIQTGTSSETKNNLNEKEIPRDQNVKIGAGHESTVRSNSNSLKKTVRSRSTSNNRCNTRASKNVAPCVSVNKSSSVSSKNGTAVKQEPDKFIGTLLKIKRELKPEEKDAQLKRREVVIQTNQKLDSFMKEGSEALMSGLGRQASEKFKAALEIITEKGIENCNLVEIDYIVLKYSLSMSWIQTSTYNNITQSVSYLTDLESEHAMELPAVYYGLGNAFYRLNRFKSALQHLDKGFQIIDKDFQITPHPWPGTMQTIAETTKIGLKESLSKLLKECKTYREPDAICRYKKCLSISTHINPSKIIFYSDPDFVGYVVILCEENCRITYHISCWKHYKDSMSAVGKVSDKDMLGRACLTSDCLFEGRRQSEIVCIEIYGGDGKKKSTCLKEPTKTDNVNEHRKEKKKKNEKLERAGKTKPIRHKVKKIIPQSQKTIVKKGKSRSAYEEFSVSWQRLLDMRSINFGFVESLQWNPTKDYFGRDDVRNMKTYLPENSMDSKSLKETKDFIFTYFYEYLKDEGPKKLTGVDRKWKEEVSQFPGIDFISKQDGICDFLLQSHRFASMYDYMCLSHQIANVYNTVQIEMEQSVSLILSCSRISEEDELAIKKCLMEDNCHHENELQSSQDVLSMPSTSFAKPDVLKKSNSSSYYYNSPPEFLFTNENSDSESQISTEDFIYECSSDEIDGLHDVSDFEEDNSKTELENYDFNSTEPDSLVTTENTNKHIPKDPNEVLLNGNHAIINSLHNQSEISQAEGSQKVMRNLVVSEDEGISKVTLPLVFNRETQTESHKNFAEEIDLMKKENKNFAEKVKIFKNENKNFAEEVQILKSENKNFAEEVQILKNENKNFAEEVQILKNENSRLRLQIKIVNDNKRNIIADFQKKIDEYQIKIKESEVKMSKGITEKDKALNNYQQELEKSDLKYDLMVKKHKEEIEFLKKKEENDSILLKKTLESMNELNKENENKAIIIKRVEAQLQRANEDILNLRKDLGESKLGFYISKCTERLDFMNFIMKYMHHMTYSEISEMERAMDDWQKVTGELHDTRDFLQIQYDILAQQLKNKVSSDCLLQLELAELPEEPPYPLQDFNNVVSIIENYVQNNFVVEQTNFVNRGDLAVGNNVPSLMRAFSESSSASNCMVAAGSSLFSDPSPSTMTHQFLPPKVNENSNCSFLGSWNNPLSDPPIITSNTVISGTIVNVNSPICLLEDQHLKPFQTSGESQPIGSPAVGASVKESSGMNTMVPLGDINKSILSIEERKSSSVCGLTSIEENIATDFNENIGHTSKLTPFERKKSSTSLKAWNFDNLMEKLINNFKDCSEGEIGDCLAVVREKNGHKLSGLTIATIKKRIGEVLEERHGLTSGSMGEDKFYGTAWEEVLDKSINWANNDVGNECIICRLGMEANSVTSLQCKHTFHTDCVRMWLHTNSTCPICRKYTCLADEFPPLS